MVNVLNEAVPNMVMFPSVFLDRMKELGLDVSIYERHPKKSVHIVKNEEKIVNSFNLSPVEWAKHCFWTDEPKKIQDMYYDSVFVQDPASVVPVLALDVTGCDHVVDLCAAPGGKTLHVARKAQYVTAVDSHKMRVKRLASTVRRFTIENCTVLHKDGRYLRLPKQVDKVLVDAPCTGEGIIGKIHKVMALWSLKRVTMLAQIQKKLVLNGLKLLRNGGTLVYSTCTFAPEENEGVVDYVLGKAHCELVTISVENLQYIHGLTFWKGKEYCQDVEKTMRIYPFHNGTNGVFVAKLRKK